MIRSYHCLICDECGCVDDYQSDKKGLRKIAQEFGWIRKNGKDLCPQCIAKKDKIEIGSAIYNKQEVVDALKKGASQIKYQIENL